MGNVRLYGATSGYTELAPPAVAPDGVLSLPSGTGTLITTADAALAGGLVHINTTSFSAVSSVSLNGVFTSAYDNYRVVMNCVGAGGLQLRVRLRASGTDNSASNSYIRQLTVAYGGVTSSSNATSTMWDTIGAVNTTPSHLDMELKSPALSAQTGVFAFAGAGAEHEWMTGYHNVSSSFDGLTVFASESNMTGKVRIYGYQN